MTPEEKKHLLAQMEWSQFQQVQNQGGRAACQDDPETFFRMRESQFASWPEGLADSYADDLRRAEEGGRNLLAEKYAWMMERTAPEEFAGLAHLLKAPSKRALDLIEEIVALQLPWMAAYRKAYPALAAGNRPLTSREDLPWETSFETYLRGELHTYSEGTLALYLDHLRSLADGGKNLTLLIMETMVRSYGYRDLAQAERQAARAAEK